MILHPLVRSPDGHKAKGEPRPSWELEIPSGFLVWVTVAHEMSIFCCFPSLVVESWIRREAARTTACTPYGVLALQAVFEHATPQCQP